MSPRGFDGVRQASAALEARRGGGGSGALWFRLSSGEETIVRFLEQDDDIFWCYMHNIPVEGRAWGRDVPCINQENDGTPCPGCERDIQRKFRGYINVVWFDAPVFKRDQSGKLVRDKADDPIVIDNKPQVAVWSSGIRLFEDLDEINANFKGLTSRRFKVKRKGEKLDTKYVINPEDIDSGRQEFTEEEKKLAAEKYNLSEFVKIGSYQDFLKELGEGSGDGSNGGGSGSTQRANPFLRRTS